VQTAVDALGPSSSDAVRAPRYATYAWATLAVTLGVILWGAFVRATGSGAGCGSHWPLCNGEVVPRSPTAATLIEFGHRLTSGLAALLVVGLAAGAWRGFPRGHLVRRSALAALVLMVLEALIGAGLVLLEHVAGDASIARAWWVSGHLVNTFLLVAALTLTAWGATHGARPRLSGAGSLGAMLAAALAAVLVVGVSGAITALGDTLFPAATLAEGEAQTFSDTAHVFVRLRVWHPLLALAAGVLVMAAAQRATRVRRSPAVSSAANLVLGLLVLQIGVGVANVSFLAPVPLQLVHLLLADLLWIALLVLAATALAVPSSR
jgi:heme A synthase